MSLFTCGRTLAIFDASKRPLPGLHDALMMKNGLVVQRIAGQLNHHLSVAGNKRSITHSSAHQATLWNEPLWILSAKFIEGNLTALVGNEDTDTGAFGRN